MKGNPFEGTYNGYSVARPAVGAAYRLAVAEVMVSAAGTVKLTYTEGKTKYTASVKSFKWDDANGTGLSYGTPYLYATVKTTEVPLPASQTFVFRTEDGETFVFDCPCEGAGYIYSISEDGEERGAVEATSVSYAYADAPFAALVPETGAFTFGWDSDAELVGADAESFAFEVMLDKNGNPAGVAIYDADPQEGEKPLATVTTKMGKATGAISVSFTSKKGDKAKYAVELVWRDEGVFAGHVTRTWKDGKDSCAAYGTVEVK